MARVAKIAVGDDYFKDKYDYREDVDPSSGAPILVSIPKTVTASSDRDNIKYEELEIMDDLFNRDNLREAWRILRKNDPFDYQIEVVDAILYSCMNNLGWYYVIMQTRQSGKNEESAFIEQYLLLYGWYYGTPISGVKFAPVYKPQVQASMDRLEGADAPDSGGLAGSAATKNIYRKSDGYKYHIGPPRDSNKWAFLSINPTANVASQTAFTLLEGDEGQDIDRNKWERDAQPMGSFNNATTVLWGVNWTSGCFINQAKHEVLDMERRLEKELGYRPKLYFKIDAYRVIQSGNVNYKKAFENQVHRLGIDHIAIQTQYLLNAIDAVNAFFTHEQLFRIFNTTGARGRNLRMRVGPDKGTAYVFGLDVAGQEEDPTEIDETLMSSGTHKRDALSLVISELQRDGTVIPVCLYQWVGKRHSTQRRNILAILKHWGTIGGCIDATGIGEALAYWIKEQLPRQDVEAYKFKYAGDESKSKLGYMVYNYVSADTFKVPPKPDNDPEQAELWDELKWQLENMIREAKKAQKINFYVPGSAKPRKPGHYAHDDLGMAAFLSIRGGQNVRNPERRKAIAANRNDYA